MEPDVNLDVNADLVGTREPEDSPVDPEEVEHGDQEAHRQL